MRIVVSSDLHYDPRGHHTKPARIDELAADMAAESPDAIVLAGDLTHGLQNFAACLAPFSALGIPYAVVPGNHDLWRAEHSSEDLWSTYLPQASRDAGAVWLDDGNLRIGDVEIVGSVAWYDYSAVDPEFARPARQLGALKGTMNNDATWIDWERTDPEFAAEVGARMCDRLAAAGADDGVRVVLVATHVPILEGQMTRKPGNERWGMSNAYFGNLTLGEKVIVEPKVKTIVSGHTHCAREGRIDRAGAGPVDFYVVGSDYGEPAYVVLEL